MGVVSTHQFIGVFFGGVGGVGCFKNHSMQWASFGLVGVMFLIWSMVGAVSTRPSSV